MRLFIAITVPEKIFYELKRVQSALPKSKMTKPKDFHLTMKYLGDGNPLYIKERLKDIKFNPFRLTLSHTGIFTKDTFPRVAWVGVLNSKELGELKVNIDTALGSRDDKPFKPHFTLARMTYVPDPEKLKKNFLSLPVNEFTFVVDRFKLIRSDITPEGPVYSEVAKFKAEGL